MVVVKMVARAGLANDGAIVSRYIRSCRLSLAAARSLTGVCAQVSESTPVGTKVHHDGPNGCICNLNNHRGSYESVGTDFLGAVPLAFGCVDRERWIVWCRKRDIAGGKSEAADENASRDRAFSD